MIVSLFPLPIKNYKIASRVSFFVNYFFDLKVYISILVLKPKNE